MGTRVRPLTAQQLHSRCSQSVCVLLRQCLASVRNLSARCPQCIPLSAGSRGRSFKKQLFAECRNPGSRTLEMNGLSEPFVAGFLNALFKKSAPKVRVLEL